MPNVRQLTVLALVATGILAACDDDPNAPDELFELSGCPTGVADVNSPLQLNFSAPVNPATVVGGNIVVSDAITGLEIPGSVVLNAEGDSTQVSFVSSQPFRFSQQLRIRVQNVRSARTNTQAEVILCELTTAPPPITEIVWRELPSASGSQLRGISVLPGPISHVITFEGALYRREVAGNFVVDFQSPYITAGFDVDFVSPDIGFGSFRNSRDNNATVTRTLDGAVTFDTIATVSGTGVNIDRLYFEVPTGSAPGFFFGVAGGGTATTAFFLKPRPTTPTTVTRQNFGGTGAIVDIDFAKPDTINGAAVSRGIRVGTFILKGQIFTTTDGGNNWVQLANGTASDQVNTYFGVAKRPNGDIFVGGGSGYLARWAKGAGETYTENRLLQNALVNPDTNDPLALQFTDVQFAPDQPNIGWAIGKQLVGFVGGTPRFQGFIFRTTDGGVTWTRQGVIDAANYGAEFPGLNRIDVYSSTLVQIAGDFGYVIEYAPDAAENPPATP